MSQEYENSNEPLKFEGVLSLINTQLRDHKEDIKNSFNEKISDLKEFTNFRFNKLDDYNKQQNHHISETIKRVDDLEIDLEKRDLTCRPIVEEIKKDMSKFKFLTWVEKRWRLILIFFSISLVLLVILIVVIYDAGLLFELGKSIIKK